MTIEEKYAAIQSEGFSWKEASLLVDMKVEALSEDEAKEKWTVFQGLPAMWRKRYGLR